ncbi:tetratricopeptide repeat protein [Nostocoides sp.]
MRGRDTLVSRNSLAGAYRWAGRFGDAVRMGEHALADCERVLGPDHPDPLATRDNLAGAYRLIGRLDEAVHLCERTLSERSRVLRRDQQPSSRAAR